MEQGKQKPNVYTCTMNPAIDLFIETDTLRPKVVNRAYDDDIQANGKGVNVSLILKELGVDSTALGFSGGFTGRYIQEYLRQKDIKTKFIEVEGPTRINVFTQVRQEDTEYKLINRGPVIKEEESAEFLKGIQTIREGDFLCVSGSVPQGVSDRILAEISRIAQNRKFHLIIDSSHDSVLECLPYKPYLLKPNEEELAGWFGQKQLSAEGCLPYLEKLLEKGAQRVLLSLGKEGCVYKDQETFIYGNAPQGRVINTACAGDSLLGAFLKGLLNNEPVKEALKHSIAVGSSTAFSKGLTDLSDIEFLEQQITIEDIKSEEKCHG